MPVDPAECCESDAPALTFVAFPCNNKEVVRVGRIDRAQNRSWWLTNWLTDDTCDAP